LTLRSFPIVEQLQIGILTGSAVLAKRHLIESLMKYAAVALSFYLEQSFANRTC